MSVETAQVVLLGAVFLTVLIMLIGTVYYGSVLTSAFGTISAQLSTSLQLIGNTFQSVSDYLVTSLTSFSTYLARAFRSFVGSVGGGFTTLSTFFEQQLTALLSSVSRNVLDVAGAIGRYILTTFFNATSGGSSIAAQLTAMGTSVMTKLAGLLSQGVVLVFNTITSAFNAGLGYVGEVITSLLNIVGGGVAATLTGIAEGISLFETLITDVQNEAIDPAMSAITSAFTDVITAINGIPNHFTAYMCKAGQCLACGICAFCRDLRIPVPTIPGVELCFPVVGCISVGPFSIPPIPILSETCDPLCDASVCSGYPVCPCPGCGISC